MILDKVINVALFINISVLIANIFLVIVKPNGPHTFPISVLITTMCFIWIKFKRAKSVKALPLV
jgi:hypothetical protein